VDELAKAELGTRRNQWLYREKITISRRRYNKSTVKKKALSLDRAFSRGDGEGLEP
jgi:hypothetical protein